MHDERRWLVEAVWFVWFPPSRDPYRYPCESAIPFILLDSMELNPDEIASFPLPLFQRYAARCCRRIEQHIADARFAKILKKLERCTGLSPEEQLRRDAFNAANAAYCELYESDRQFSVAVAAMCTLVCACEAVANPNLLGNFRSVLERTEKLSVAKIRQIQVELLDGLAVRTGWDEETDG